MKTKGILQPILVCIAIGCCVARGAELPATHLSLQRTDSPAFVLPGVQIHRDVLSLDIPWRECEFEGELELRLKFRKK